MQEKKIWCILLQSASGGQGDIPIPVEKGTLTRTSRILQEITVLQVQYTVPVSLKNFLSWLLKPDVNICIQQIRTIYNTLLAGLMNSHWWHLAAAVFKLGWYSYFFKNT